jgi:TolA-binding protein
MVVKKETFTDRAKAGRALVFIAAALKPFQSTKPIGNAGGFPISIHKFDERANLTIHGKNSYNANVSDSALGTIASVEHALESMEDRLRERESDLKQYRKQSEDLTKQLDHPFEHEEKLTVPQAAAGDRHRPGHHEEPSESVEVAQEKTGPKMANNAAARTSQGVTV